MLERLQGRRQLDERMAVIELLTPGGGGNQQPCRRRSAAAHPLHDASVLPLIGLCTSCAMYARAPEGHENGRVLSRATLDHGRDFRAWCERFGLDPTGEGLPAQAADKIPDQDDPFA